MFKLVHLKTPPTSADIWWSLKQAGTTHPAGMFSFFGHFCFRDQKSLKFHASQNDEILIQFEKEKTPDLRHTERSLHNATGRVPQGFLFSFPSNGFHSIPFSEYSSYVLQKQAPEKDTTFSNSLLENWNAWILSFVWMNKNATTMSVVTFLHFTPDDGKLRASHSARQTDSILLTLLFPFNREVHRVAGDISMKAVTGGGGWVNLDFITGTEQYSSKRKFSNKLADLDLCVFVRWVGAWERWWWSLLSGFHLDDSLFKWQFVQMTM